MATNDARYVTRFRPRDREAGTLPGWTVVDTAATPEDGPAILVCTTTYEDRARLVADALNAHERSLGRGDAGDQLAFALAGAELAEVDANTARATARALLEVIERWVRDGHFDASLDALHGGPACWVALWRTDADREALHRLLQRCRAAIGA